MRWIKTPKILKKVFPNFVWEVPNKEKKVYLTFDDGPTPEITTWVLSELKKHNAKATFFCIGDNINAYPDIFEQLIANYHSVGNHSFNHLNGWKTNTTTYLENIEKCNLKIKEEIGRIENKKTDFDDLQNSNFKPQISNLNFLFRPPYGRIKNSQTKLLRKLGYKIIMWDVISYDFDKTISKERCLQNVIKNIEPGSIIVFHDSVKAFENLRYILPRTLQFLSEKGFVCEAI